MKANVIIIDLRYESMTRCRKTGSNQLHIYIEDAIFGVQIIYKIYVLRPTWQNLTARLPLDSYI